MPDLAPRSRASIRLAFIAVLQHLPPRQRATLILRDVLAWRSAEVADLLETTPTAINSALQRARTQLGQIGLVEEDVVEPGDAEQLDILNRHVTAFQASDLPGLTVLLREDARSSPLSAMALASGRLVASSSPDRRWDAVARADERDCLVDAAQLHATGG